MRLRRGSVEKVAREACKAADAFFFIFIHADTGGRDLAAGISARSRSYCEAMRELCGWPATRCIVISPRHETEAWILADAEAITATLGYGLV